MIVSIYLLVAIVTGLSIWLSREINPRIRVRGEIPMLLAMSICWPFWWTLVLLFWVQRRIRGD